MALSFINLGVQQIFKSGGDFLAYAAEEFEESPEAVTSAAALLGLSIFAASKMQGRWGESLKERIGRFALQIPGVQGLYDKDIQKQYVASCKEIREQWAPFEQAMPRKKLLTKIPEQGWGDKKIFKLLKDYHRITMAGLQGMHHSGTVYIPELSHEVLPIVYDKQEPQNDREYLIQLSKRLNALFNTCYDISKFWNSLHTDEFPAGSVLEYQVSRMVAGMFGGNPKEVMGIVTSGGTESLMLAMRAYRNFGMREKGHKPGEGVIIAPKSVHAAVLKAAQAYCLKVVLVDTDENGRIDLQQLEKTVQQYHGKAVAMVGSAPAYPKGNVDPIEEMAALAKKYGIGFHADACLGGFVINNVREHTNYLAMPGVTSCSACNHKSGFAPKGSSTLVTQKLHGKNLLFYATYPVPDWEGGLYGTVKDAGSQSCTPALVAFVAMLAIGQDGYRRIAKLIQKATTTMAAEITKHKGKLVIQGDADVNVVAFKIDPAWGMKKGATYALAKEMSKRGFVLNKLPHDAAHFCITAKFLVDPQGMDKFKTALAQSLDQVVKLNKKLKPGQEFPGAAQYGSAGRALEPKPSELGWGKYFQYWLFGRQGLNDAVRSHYLAVLDPYVGA